MKKERENEREDMLIYVLSWSSISSMYILVSWALVYNKANFLYQNKTETTNLTLEQCFISVCSALWCSCKYWCWQNQDYWHGCQMCAIFAQSWSGQPWYKYSGPSCQGKGNRIRKIGQKIHGSILLRFFWLSLFRDFDILHITYWLIDTFVFQTVCLIGVVEKYKELAKYNLRQLTSSQQ